MEEVVVEEGGSSTVIQGPKFWDYLYSLRQSASLCDIQLCVKVLGRQESLSLPAHKLVLAASSRYFSHCLQVNDFLDEYNFDGISVEHLQAVIDYMYRQISWEQLCEDPMGKVVAETLQVVYHDDKESSSPSDGQVHTVQGTGFVREVQRRQPQRYKRNYIPPTEVQAWIEASREVVPHKTRGRKPSKVFSSSSIKECVLSNSDILDAVGHHIPAVSEEDVKFSSKKIELQSESTFQDTGSITHCSDTENVPTENSTMCSELGNTIENPGSFDVAGCGEMQSKIMSGDEETSSSENNVRNCAEGIDVDQSVVESSAVCSDTLSEKEYERRECESMFYEAQNSNPTCVNIGNTSLCPVTDSTKALCEGKDTELAQNESGTISLCTKLERSAECNDTLSKQICETSIIQEAEVASSAMKSEGHETIDLPIEIEKCGMPSVKGSVLISKELGIKVVHTPRGEKVYCIEPAKFGQCSETLEKRHRLDLKSKTGNICKGMTEREANESSRVSAEDSELGDKFKGEVGTTTNLEPSMAEMTDSFIAKVEDDHVKQSLKSNRYNKGNESDDKMLETLSDDGKSKDTKIQLEQYDRVSTEGVEVIESPIFKKFTNQENSPDKIKVQVMKSNREVKANVVLTNKNKNQSTGVGKTKLEKSQDVFDKTRGVKSNGNVRRGPYKMDDKVKEYLKKVKQMKKQNGKLMKKRLEEQVDDAESDENQVAKRCSGNIKELVTESFACKPLPQGIKEDLYLSSQDLKASDEDEPSGQSSIKRRNLEEFAHECVFCEQRFDSVQSLNSHISLAECTKTPQARKSAQWRDTHTSKEESQLMDPGRKYPCDRCQQIFENQKGYYQHLEEQHNELPYKCKKGQCDASFGSYEGLKDHIRMQHSPDKSEHICLTCGKNFRLKQQLRNHMTSTHKERADIPCKLCGRMFKQFSGLKRHLKTFHSEERNFPCSVCHRCFKTKDDKNKHEKRHFQPNKRVDEFGNRIAKYPVGLDYPCSYCKKTFKNFYHKKAHENIQHEDKQDGVSYLCTLCNKSFSTRHYLNMHVNNTHRPKNIQCQACLRRFSFKYEIKRHLPKCKGYPVGPKPYECTYCGCSFTMKGNLTKHVQRGKCSGKNKGVEVVTTSNTDFVVVIHQDNDSSVQIPITQLTELGVDSDTKRVEPIELVSEVSGATLGHSPFVIKTKDAATSSTYDAQSSNNMIVYSTETGDAVHSDTSYTVIHTDAEGNDIETDNMLVSDGQSMEATVIYATEETPTQNYVQSIVNIDTEDHNSEETTGMVIDTTETEDNQEMTITVHSV